MNLFQISNDSRSVKELLCFYHRECIKSDTLSNDKDADGDMDLQDLKAIFSGSGSIVDKVKGIFQ